MVGAMMRFTLDLVGRIWLALTYLFLALPLVFVAGGSFSERRLQFPPDGFTVNWYAQIPPSFMDAVTTSLVVAAAGTLIAIPCGVMAAFPIVRGRFPGRQILSGLLLSPIMLPMLVVGIAIYQSYVWLWQISGLQLGGTLLGLIIAHASFTGAYVLRSVVAVLVAVDPQLEEAAFDLGAGSWMTFRRVTFPLIKPGVVAGAVLAFLVSFDNLPVSLFLTGPRLTPLPIAIYNYIEFNLDPMILALSTVVTAGSLAFVVVLERMLGIARVMGLEPR
jgi:putative spermidine/putrescine transport system permease protein